VDVTQAKQRRRGPGSGGVIGHVEYERFFRWADMVTMEELVMMRNGSVEEDVIYANETMGSGRLSGSRYGKKRMLLLVVVAVDVESCPLRTFTETKGRQ
jgi:hypothetical protein